MVEFLIILIVAIIAVPILYNLFMDWLDSFCEPRK